VFSAADFAEHDGSVRRRLCHPEDTIDDDDDSVFLGSNESKGGGSAGRQKDFFPSKVAL
jgi:hypothetical protein